MTIPFKFDYHNIRLFVTTIISVINRAVTVSVFKISILSSNAFTK